ncbi:hypothetical protein LMB46_00895, partial [Limosilactobacillus reuteri]|nr:hypothetical protein [Limosilactobacillus reuteri]MCC4353226.1 hypothetical protein [Limosilactobacillus reuteri]
SFFAVVKKRTRRMSRIENPREAIKDGSTGIFCLSITCQYRLLTNKPSNLQKHSFTARPAVKINVNEVELTIFKGTNSVLASD